MSSIKCPICFENHSSKLPFSALKCGHIFCEPCLGEICQSARNNRQRPFCPTCRAPFREGPPDVILLYPEYDSDDEISANQTGLLKTRDQQDVEQLATRADNIGIESDAAELQGVIARGEDLLKRFKEGSGGDGDGVEILSSMEEHLGRLRHRLNYHHRIASLKQEVARLEAERDEHRDARDEQHAKYLQVKQNWRALYDKNTQRKEELQAQTQMILERDARIYELEKLLQAAHGKLAKQTLTSNNATKALEATVKELEEKLAKQARENLKLEKKYLVKKAELQDLERKHAKCKQARSHPSSEVDDSLEIVLAPKPARLRASASSSSIVKKPSNTSLRKSGSTSSLASSVLKERNPPPRLPTPPFNWDDLEPGSPSRRLQGPSSSRSKPNPNLTNALVSRSRPKPKPVPFPFQAPSRTSSKGKGKVVAMPSSESDIQVLGVHIPSPPPAKRRKVSTEER